MELNNEKKQGLFHSEEYNNISKGNAFLLQCLTNDLGNFTQYEWN